MPSVISQKMQKTTLRTSLRTKEPKAAVKDVFTVRDCDAILKEFGFRPATTEEVATVRDAESRTKAKQAKRLLAA
jgi:hypothetical protein